MFDDYPSDPGFDVDTPTPVNGESDPIVVRKLRRAADVLGWLAVALGSIVLVVGWWLGIDIVARVIPDQVTMKANTAVGIAAAGFAIVFYRQNAPGWRRTAALGAAALVTIIGWTTLIEYTAGIAWTGFDEILITEGGDAVATSNPGRMGANTAFNYSILGPALMMLLLSRGIRFRQVLALVVTAVGFAASVGYALNVPELSGLIGGATQMAINTSILHSLLGLAVLFCEPTKGLLQPAVSRRMGGKIIRLYTPAALAILLVIAVSAERILAPRIGVHALAQEMALTVLVMGIVLMIALIGRRVNRLDRHAENVRRKRQEISELNRQLENLLDSRDELIAAVSHELRTPLTSVIGYAEVLRNSKAELSEAERDEMLATIAREGADLANIVEDLLTVAKSRVGDLVVARVPVNLTEQVEMVVGSIEHSGVRVEVTQISPAEALGDPNRVRQVLRNLLTNAIKHGGKSIRIEVEQTPTTAVVRVSDDGPGIPDGRRHAVFDAYERARDEPGLAGSLGLGLTVSRTLAEAMDGELDHHRTAGRTVFELTLDLTPQTENQQV